MSNTMRSIPSRLFWGPVWTLFGPLVQRCFHTALLLKTTNFTTVTWLGHPLLQNVLDLWTIQETIAQLRPALIIETGTNRGGSAQFYAHLFDLMGTDGRIVTIDIQRQHNLQHPRITALTGDSVAPSVTDQVAQLAAEARGPVFVILDSDHSEAHVARELEIYSRFVTPGSRLLVQDSAIDTLGYFRAFRPGPLPAIHKFLQSHSEFQIDRERCERFLLTDHPDGWLVRSAAP
jgi:cephalosporin hydroxylase